MLKAVFFDLDGTLLPMDEQSFIKAYFSLLCQRMARYGYSDSQMFIKTIWDGTKAMYANDGTKTNEEIFWTTFCKAYGEKVYNDKQYFNDFYSNEFLKVKEVIQNNPLASSIVHYAKKKAGIVVLATNPFFPRVGTVNRMGFTGLKEEDFDYITTYEDSCYCKPNPSYFKALLQKFNLKPSEVIMFGNNDVEDYKCAKEAGIDCYLVGKFVILHEDKNINAPIISMEEVIPTIDKEYEKRINND